MEYSKIYNYYLKYKCEISNIKAYAYVYLYVINKNYKNNL